MRISHGFPHLRSSASRPPRRPCRGSACLEQLESRQLLSGGALTDPAATVPPLDLNAVFRTNVPHTNSQITGGGGSGPSRGKPGSSTGFVNPPYSVGSTVTPTTSAPEAEEHIAVAPGAPNNLVAAISDFSLRGGYNTTKYAVSTDGGSTWADHFVPLDTNDYPTTSDGKSWEANSDPVVAIDLKGNVYLADLYFNGSNNANGVYVSVGSLSSGVNFTASATRPVAANYDPSTSTSEDKEWIAVDNSSNSGTTGNVYVSWTRFVGNSDSIVLSRSTDQGGSWSSAPIRISPSSQDGAVQGSQVAVGPDGAVYVAYEVFYVGNQRQQFLTKSTDGGQTFSTPVAVTPVFNELSFNSTYRKDSFSALAVAPNNANDVYLVYADQQGSKAGAQVEFIRSTDGGATFTSPVAINDVASGQQFMPALTVDNLGTIHASWFDTRNSPRTTSIYDIYATFSTDGGTTFHTNARVTATSLNAGGSSFIGDYAGIAAANGVAHPVWTSGGSTGQLQTAALTDPSSAAPQAMGATASGVVQIFIGALPQDDGPTAGAISVVDLGSHLRKKGTLLHS